MKKCELCKFPARAFCESDRASLCWDCDAKVHGANFLVARHSRGLLCLTCQSLTPWRASGSELGRTISVCERCTSESLIRKHEEEDDDEEEEEGSGDSGSANDDDVDAEGDVLEDEDDEDDGDGDNQVVPWSSTPPTTRSPSSASTSSEDSVSRSACSDGENFESLSAVSLKRKPDSSADPRSPLQEVVDRPSSQWKCDCSALTTQASGGDFSSRAVKYQRIQPGLKAVQAGSRSAPTIESSNRF